MVFVNCCDLMSEQQFSALLSCCTSSEKRCAYEESLMFMIKVNEGRCWKVLETFLLDSGPYCHDNITQLLQICRLHIHDTNLPFHHIPKVLYWIKI